MITYVAPLFSSIVLSFIRTSFCVRENTRLLYNLRTKKGGDQWRIIHAIRKSYKPKIQQLVSIQSNRNPTTNSYSRVQTPIDR